mmetsp:Transcript_143251/g.260572  ORF Transcript_143251/g.260572 Transcript_143251/m.260572 type:complete len:357 (+) Transcript_143251:95-1165(+)
MVYPTMQSRERPSGMVIWLHGLGQSASSFEPNIQCGLARKMPWIDFQLPEAPEGPVTYLFNERKRRWFDIKKVPVEPNSEMVGISAAVARVHELLKQAESRGIPASRIVLAGFSQGGLLALQAGLTYPNRVAGICTFSAWIPKGLLQCGRHKGMPILMGHGDEDVLVPYQLGEKSCRDLGKAGYACEFAGYVRLGHGICHTCFEDLAEFLLKHLPEHKGATRFGAAGGLLERQWSGISNESSTTDSSLERLMMTETVQTARPSARAVHSCTPLSPSSGLPRAKSGQLAAAASTKAAQRPAQAVRFITNGSVTPPRLDSVRVEPSRASFGCAMNFADTPRLGAGHSLLGAPRGLLAR